MTSVDKKIIISSTIAATLVGLIAFVIGFKAGQNTGYLKTTSYNSPAPQLTNERYINGIPVHIEVPREKLEQLKSKIEQDNTEEILRNSISEVLAKYDVSLDELAFFVQKVCKIDIEPKYVLDYMVYKFKHNNKLSEFEKILSQPQTSPEKIIENIFDTPDVYYICHEIENYLFEE